MWYALTRAEDQHMLYAYALPSEIHWFRGCYIANHVLREDARAGIDFCDHILYVQMVGELEFSPQ